MAVAGGRWVRKSIVRLTINLRFRRGGMPRLHGRFQMFRLMSAAAAAVVLATPAFARVLSYPESFHTQMMQTNGTNLYVRVGGHGPAVVLLHGFGDTGDMWAPLAAVLVKDHTVIVPDLRGMGLSDHPDTGYTKKAQATDIAGVMDRSEEHTSELQSLAYLVCRLLLEKKKKTH